MFVSALGWEVELETHHGFLGGLPRQGTHEHHQIEIIS
jgi:hypothetical protein